MPLDYGLFHDMSEDAYNAVRALRASTLKPMRSQTPKHARYHYDHPKPPTDSMMLGRAVDLAILEPGRFDDLYIEAPEEFVEKRSNAAKDWWAETAAAGKEPIKPKDLRTCLAMRRAVWDDPAGRALLQAPGLDQPVAVWRDEDYALDGKARMDRLVQLNGVTLVVDLKTTVKIDPWGFSAQCAQLDYFLQLAWYRRGLAILAPAERHVAVLAVENEPPHDVVVYRPDERDMAQAEMEALECAARWKQCEAEGLWPGYGEGIHRTLRYPKYRRNDDE